MESILIPMTYYYKGSSNDFFISRQEAVDFNI